MDLSGIKDFLFRHVEKIVLAGVFIFVCHQVYKNLFPSEEEQPRVDGKRRDPVAMPSKAIDASYWAASAPYVNVPRIEAAKYNWFYPPTERWGPPVVLLEGEKGREEGRRAVLGKVVGVPQVSDLTEEEMKERGLPEPPPDPPTPCEVSVTVEPGSPGSPEGDTLLIKGTKPGRWKKITVTLATQDRYCVAVMMYKFGIRPVVTLAQATIEEIREEPLGTVVIRFTAEEGTIKSDDGKKITTYVEPTYYEILCKSEFDPQELVVGYVPGRTFKPVEGPGGVQPKVGPKELERPGLPREGRPPTIPSKKEPGIPRKGETKEDPKVMVFRDQNIEAETKYTYSIRSVLIPKEDQKPLEPVSSKPFEYRTDPRFTFAYVGGTASRAVIRVFIGPRDEKGRGGKSKLFEDIPVGGWVGEVPKQYRPAAPERDAKGGKGVEAKAAAPAPAAAGLPGAGIEGGVGGHADEAAEEGPAALFVTRVTLVAIEQNIMRLVPVKVSVPRPAKGGFVEVHTFQDRQDRRVILLDRKGRLHYLWFEPKDVGAGVHEKGGKEK
ncbi:MAG: hypothetical protein FJ291_01395 [Planctomycetes bacterium]|nr:hypothetical protein [Planctomycetota bacterium]